MTKEAGIQSSLSEDEMKLYLQQVIEEIKGEVRISPIRLVNKNKNFTLLICSNRNTENYIKDEVEN